MSKQSENIRELLVKLNACHDGGIRKIIFRKDCEYTPEGDLSFGWRGENIPPEVKGTCRLGRCDIEVELLLNSYIGARKNQVVWLTFEDVVAFQFIQKKFTEWVEVYEVTFQELNHDLYEFTFVSADSHKAETRTKSLTIQCKGFQASESDVTL